MTLTLLALALAGLAAPEAPTDCLPDDGGQFHMAISGSFEAQLDWSGDRLVCEGMPRPDGTGLRLMFGNEADELLIVLGVSGLSRGATGRDLPANLTLVRQGLGEFYGTLGEGNCRVDILENRPLGNTGQASWRIRGEGRCQEPVGAIGNDGAVSIAPFSFTGVAAWPGEPEGP